jgi:uncharacterized protein
VAAHFQWNYTTFLNFAFLAVLAALYWLYRNRERLGGGVGYAIDPVCGMQVRTADAPATTTHQDTRVYFCSDQCRERYEREPDRYRPSLPSRVVSGRDSEPATTSSEHDAVDPICGMRVNPATAAAHRRRDGRAYYFCGMGCAEAFDQQRATQ